MGVPSAHRPGGSINGSAEHLGSEQGLPSDAGQIARLVMEGVSNGIAALDIEGRFTLVNPAGCEIVGRSAEALIGRPFVDVVAPEHLAALIGQLSRVVQHRDRVSGIELDVVRPNGERRTVRASLAPVVHSGTVTGVIGTAEDITEQRLAAERRSRVETSWRRITEAMFDLVCMLDEQARFVMVTPRFTSVLGYQPEELVGTFAFELIHPDDRQEVAKSFAEALVEPDGGNQRFRFRAADGRWVWFEANANTIQADDGSVRVVVVARDITERLRMEEALRANEEHLRAFMANAPVILFAVDKDRRYRLAEGHGLATIGRGRGSPVGRTIDEVHADRPDLRRNIERALAGEDLTVVSELGGRTYEARLKPMVDGDGAISGMLGVAIDVTERVRAKAALEEKSQLLALALAAERERSRRDPLTGMLNHAAVTEELREAIKARTGPVAIAMVDVDGLKAANDMYGHQFGDAVLVTVAQELARADAIVGRYGGDEFFVLLPGRDRAAAERYRREVMGSLSHARVEDPATGTRVPVVASIGVAVYPDDASAVDELIRVADRAMYATRRDRVVERSGTQTRSAAAERTTHMLGEVIPLLTREGSLGEKLRMVANRVSLGAGYDAVNIVLGSGDERHFASGAFGQIGPDLLEAWNRRQRGSDALRERMHRTRRPVIVDDFSTSELLTPDDKAALAAMNLRSGLVAPMLWGDAMVGSFSAASKRTGAFSVRDAEFVMDVATQVTAVVRMSTLVDQLRETSARLRDAHEGTVLMLASAAEAHDMTTGRHLSRVREITIALARELGYADTDAQELGLAATLHDIGKIRVPDSVLGSAQALAEAEWMLMKQHTLWGSAFLAGQPGFELAAAVARSHHERWDGGGYPDGLAGDQIPEAAQITTVADSLDAMTNDRPYRAGRPLADAIAEIVACSGTQFSPRVVQALVRLYERGELGFVRDDAHEHYGQARAA